MGGGGGGARLSEFFSKNPNRIKRIQILKKNKNCLFVEGGRLEEVNFFTKN